MFYGKAAIKINDLSYIVCLSCVHVGVDGASRSLERSIEKIYSINTKDKYNNNHSIYESFSVYKRESSHRRSLCPFIQKFLIEFQFVYISKYMIFLVLEEVV
jgi:hypothetical protein